MSRGCARMEFSFLPVGEGLGKRGIANDGESFKPSPQPSPKGRGSKNRMLRVGDQQIGHKKRKIKPLSILPFRTS